MKKTFLFGISILLFMNSCGSSKKISSSKKTKSKNDNPVVKVSNPATDNKANESLDFNILKYIAKYKDISKKEMKDYGVPTSITLAQGILESQSGNSNLATQGNNHFGIKCHKNWRGQTILHDDDESQECFRKYLNPEESFKDHSQFLATRKRYAFLFRLPKTDYESWARGLKRAGYATDPSYPEKLIYIIEKYNLNKLDKEVLESMSVKVDEINSLNKNKKKKFVYEVKEGETLFTISQKYNIPVKDIQRINNLNDFDIYEGQIIVLTESKESDTIEPQISKIEEEPNTSAQTVVDAFDTKTTNETTQNDNVEPYTVKEGETLFSIAKDKNIKIEDLKTANNLITNDINVGDVIDIPLDKINEVVKETVIETPVETPVKTPVETVVPEPADNKQYHIVQPKETLYRIHINYGVSIKKLRKLNKLKGNYIKVGQKLRIK
jgi:flagellum-specific peptidoglycan hydrolase FlgJ